MEEPFDITAGGSVYSVFPEENDIYTVFKEGIEYMKIQKDDNEQWLKLDPETELPLFTENAEVNLVGHQIRLHNG